MMTYQESLSTTGCEHQIVCEHVMGGTRTRHCSDCGANLLVQYTKVTCPTRASRLRQGTGGEIA